jgi:DnaJ-class molecular chaperone
MSSYYDLLGVPPTASTDELAAAFREKALSAHPDVPGGDAATFRALSDAYAVLRDPAQRALYDSTLRGGPGPLDDGVDAFDRWWRRSGFASPSPDPAARRAAAAADAAAAAAGGHLGQNARSGWRPRRGRPRKTEIIRDVRKQHGRNTTTRYVR